MAGVGGVVGVSSLICLMNRERLKTFFRGVRVENRRKRIGKSSCGWHKIRRGGAVNFAFHSLAVGF